MGNVSTILALAAFLLTNTSMATAATIPQHPIGELEPIVTLRIGTIADWVAITSALAKVEPSSNRLVSVLDFASGNFRRAPAMTRLRISDALATGALN